MLRQKEKSSVQCAELLTKNTFINQSTSFSSDYKPHILKCWHIIVQTIQVKSHASQEGNNTMW